MTTFQPSPELYPFRSRWFASSVGQVHFVDEGSGPTLLLCHGNPDWSFLYRHVIGRLRSTFRCVAMDYPGFGLSPHPDEYGYTPGEHAVILRELVESLGLRDMIVVGQDWGGPIGMGMAARSPELVAGMVMCNTWFWPADAALSTFSRVLSTRAAQALITRRNVLVDPLFRRSLARSLTPDELRHYSAVAPTPASRAGFAAFPRQIRAAAPWLAETEELIRQHLADRPILLAWGMRDRFMTRPAVLGRWQRTFEHHRLVELPGAGHFPQEDAPHELAEAILETFGSPDRS